MDILFLLLRVRSKDISLQDYLQSWPQSCWRALSLGGVQENQELVDATNSQGVKIEDLNKLKFEK